MLQQYPAIEPFNTFTLQVDDPHELYVEQCGNSEGLPVLFLHGGPGSGCSASDRCFFDPEIYHIILFDQRGTGRSTPHACLENNTTQDLINDIEALRDKLGIKQWVIFGGSWGSTLSLAYAQSHPESVSGLILRGIFLGTKAEIQWLYGSQGAAHVFPDYYESFIKPVTSHGLSTDKIIQSYYQLLTSDDEVSRMAAAKAWSIWEGRAATLEPDHQTLEKFSNPHFALSIARIECHYFNQECFLKTNQLLNNIKTIQHLPGIIVQGRYDMITPMNQAWQLHQAWPESQLNIIRDAGHSSKEPGITDALIRGTQSMAKKLGWM